MRTLPLLIGTARDNDVDFGDMIFLEVPDYEGGRTNSHDKLQEPRGTI